MALVAFAPAVGDGLVRLGGRVLGDTRFGSDAAYLAEVERQAGG